MGEVSAAIAVPPAGTARGVSLLLGEVVVPVASQTGGGSYPEASSWPEVIRHNVAFILYVMTQLFRNIISHALASCGDLFDRHGS